MCIALTYIILLFVDFDYDKASKLGDAFGAANALFSALAFAFIIYTALMQRKELELQRNELRETKKEISRSAQAHEQIVQLTREQLSLEQISRKIAIQPVIEFLSNNLNEINENKYLNRFQFKVSKNQLSINGLEVKGIFGTDFSMNHHLVNKELIEDDHFYVDLQQPCKELNQFDFELTIYYRDTDNEDYEQTLKYHKESLLFSNPRICKRI